MLRVYFKNAFGCNTYDATNLVSKLGLNSKRIDCCMDGCMLFYDNEYGKNNDALLECKFC